MTSVLYMTLWGFRECGVPLHYHYSYVYSDPEWKYLLGSPLRQIELFNHLLYLITFNSVQTNDKYLIELLVLRLILWFAYSLS